MFMKGDKVFDIVRGKGIVESVVDTSFPINVQFRDTSRCTVSYTAEGREFTNHTLPTLYHGECAPTICAPEPKRMPKLAVDAHIIVRDGEEGREVKRHFCRWEGDRAVTWADGFTSWSVTDQGIIIWDNWRLPEESDDS